MNNSSLPREQLLGPFHHRHYHHITFGDRETTAAIAIEVGADFGAGEEVRFCR